MKTKDENNFGAKAKSSIIKEEEDSMYAVPEEKIINYFLKIEHERKVILHYMKMFFSEEQFFPLDDLLFASLCEYFSIIQHMETLFNDIIEFAEYDEKIQSYYANQKQQMSLMVFLQSLLLIREELFQKNISLGLH